MLKLVAIEYVSLDGVMQVPGDAGDGLEGEFVHGGCTDTLDALRRAG
jgi:hypothetical protein